MKLRTPITGTTIVVADDKAQGYIDQGFQRIVEPVKAPPRKATAKKSKSKEQ